MKVFSFSLASPVIYNYIKVKVIILGMVMFDFLVSTILIDVTIANYLYAVILSDKYYFLFVL